MAILRERVSWRLPRRTRTSDLTPDEQDGVRRALDALRLRHESIVALAKEMGCEASVIVRAKTSAPTVRTALLVARIAGVPLSDVLCGEWPKPGACLLCGHVPEASA